MHTKYLHYAWKTVLAFALAAVMALSVVTEVFVRTSAQSVIAEDGKYYTDYDSLEEAQEAAADLALDVASEGDTLLKNKDGALPLKGGEYVSVFGTAQDSLANYNGYPLLDALEDEGFRVNPKLRNYYESIGTTFGEEQSTFAKTIEGSYNLYNDVAIVVLSRGGGEGNDMATVTDEEAADDRNVNGWEHKDLYEEDGKTYKHFLQMTDSEEALFDYVKAQGFKKIVYLINSSEIFEMYNLENDDAVNAILWIGRPGQEGTKAAAKILSGAVNPSGKTVDTWYTDFTADPTWQNFGTNVQIDSTNNYSKADGTATAPEGGGGGFGGGEGYFGIDYEEDIYVGYRYYETAAKEGVIDYDKAVVYPFGYGLSYTTFSYSDMSVKMSDGSDMTSTLDADLFSSSVGSPAKVKTATATVTVTNDGKVAGKETVELYVTAPYTKGEVEKAHVTLVAFAKTDLLQPGQSQTLEIPFNVQDLASYDYTNANKNGNKGYEMDAGEYILRVMGNAHGWAAADAGEASADYQEARFTLDADVIMKLDDFSDNEVTNLFSQENGIFYSLRDNTKAKYQFNKDASANETLMSRADLAGTFPVAPTAADMTLSEKMYESLQYWDNFSVDNDATYADGKVVEGIADADDYPWMAEVTENSERMKTWTQTGEYGIMLSEMSGIDPFGSEEITFRGEKMTEAAAWDAFMNTLSWEDIQALCVEWQKLAFEEIGMNALVGNDSAWNYASTFCFTCNCILAATWNTELAEKQGEMIGNLALLKGSNTWWGNSANTHRSPFAGRVFEYLSEDGILAGYIGSAETRGAQSKGLVCYMKHCALNDQETNRNGRNLMAWVSEQAMREIYYKSFQMCAQEGESMGAMGAFARAGRVSINVNYNYVTELFRNQWGCETISFTTDMYAGMKMASPPDMLIRSGTDTIATSTLSGTWDAEQNCVVVGTGKTKSDVQWYTARKCAMIFLYAHANSSMNQNGIVFDEWEGTALNFAQGVAIEGAAVGSGIEADEVKYFLVSGTLPGGVTLNADGTLSGTPTQAGTFDVTVECKADVWISAQREYSIEVASAFTIDTTEGKLGEEFYAVIESDTVNNKNYTSVEYDIAEGSLPKGLTLAANGELEGTPTEAGSFPLTVRVTATTVTSGWRPVTTYTYFEYELTLEIAEGDVSDVPLVEIGENGNWFIEGVDTGVSATGPQGPQGPAGEDGQKPEITISEDGFWVIDGEKTTVSAQGPQGPAGPAGEDGKGCGGSIGAVSAIGAVVLLAAVGALLLARRKEN